MKTLKLDFINARSYIIGLGDSIHFFSATMKNLKKKILISTG